MRIEAEAADRLRAVLAGQPQPRRGPRRGLPSDHQATPDEEVPLPPIRHLALAGEPMVASMAEPPSAAAEWPGSGGERADDLEPLDHLAYSEPLDDPRRPEHLASLEPAERGVPGPRPAPTGVASAVRAFTLRHLQAIGIIAVVALVFVATQLFRAEDSEVPLAPPVEPASPNPASTSSASTPGASTKPALLVVHVTGGVRSPGVVTLPVGSRVNDALKAAGGLVAGAQLGSLNLAAPLTDGMQIIVGSASNPLSTTSAPSAQSAGGSPGQSQGGALVNLNTATQAQLEELPGVGPVMAGRIIEWREKNGSFTSVNELQEVDGVGAKTFERLKPLVTV